jgi:hypothetical protein
MQGHGDFSSGHLQLAGEGFGVADWFLGLRGMNWSQLLEKSVVAPVKERRIAPMSCLAAEAAGLLEVSDACRAMIESCPAA